MILLIIYAIIWHTNDVIPKSRAIEIAYEYAENQGWLINAVRVDIVSARFSDETGKWYVAFKRTSPIKDICSNEEVEDSFRVILSHNGESVYFDKL